MEDIYAILNVNKEFLQNFHLQADHLVDHQTALEVSKHIRTLRSIEERMMADAPVIVSRQAVDEIIEKVIRHAEGKNLDVNVWSIRELRIISYSLIMLSENGAAYEYALELLDKKWRDMFFRGLSFCCLDSWNAIAPSLRQLTCDLIRKKLMGYSGHDRKYVAMRNKSDLFDNAGPYRLCRLLILNGKKLDEAPAYFANKPSTISQSYYSDVIVQYFEAKNIMDLNYLEDILEKHKEDRTKKLLFADMVVRVNNNGNESQRTQLCKFANRILGNITLSATWAPFVGATDDDRRKLISAKSLINNWVNKRIIETFFEVCVQDTERKDFWLNYVDYVSSFKIVGSVQTMYRLQGDRRVSNIFEPHYIKTSHGSATTSALVLFIRNKMMVEFSDTGALYVYNQGHEKEELVKRRNVQNISDLKITTMNDLIRNDSWKPSYYEEGRMPHLHNWQWRLRGWMQSKVL